MSRVFLNKSPFVEAYEFVTWHYQDTISTAVYIELQHWLLIQRGLLSNPISRTEYERYRRRLDNSTILNSDGVSEEAIKIAR